MTRRAFLSSKSNTAAGEIELKHACQNSWQIAPKNEDFSKSVNSFRSGAIFLPPLGQDLSRHAFVVSIAFPERISHWRKGPGHDLRNRDFYDFSTFS